MALTNAEKQAAYRARQAVEHEALIEALRKQTARLRRENPTAKLGFKFTLDDGSRVEIDERGYLTLIEPKGGK